MSMKDVKEEVSFAGLLLRWGLIALVVIGALGFIGKYMGLMSASFFQPKVEQVRYDTFKQSQSYNDGMVRDLQELRRQYITATPEQQDALRAITLHRFDAYDVSRLPVELQLFHSTLNRQ